MFEFLCLSFLIEKIDLLLLFLSLKLFLFSIQALEKNNKVLHRDVITYFVSTRINLTRLTRCCLLSRELC